MNFEELSLSSFIKEVKEVTTGTHPRKFCFVLGAGASRSSGVKSGQDLVKIWDKELRERNFDEYNLWRKSFGITDENLYGFYSQYYEKRFKRCPSDGYNYIEKIMASAKPSAGYVMLAHILTNYPHNVVVTTNFDHLTEDAVNYYAQQTPLVIGHEYLSHYVSAQPVRPTIIKIHRDLLFDPKSRTADLEKLSDNWKTPLGLIFKNYHPIFIGYAGNDNSLMDFLIENAKKFANNDWKYPYWTLYGDEKPEEKILAFVSKTNGHVIRHAGFDDVMIQLGAAFDYKTPTEEEFMKDAKRRYKSLSDAIDAFSDKSKRSEIEVVGEKASKTLEVTNENGSSQESIAAIQKIASRSEMQQQYQLAIQEMTMGNYKQAEEILVQLINQDPDNSRYRRSYGRILLEQQKPQEALAEFDNCLKIEENNEMTHYLRGSALEQMRRYEEALTQYRIALELKPEDEFNHFKVANMLEELKRYEEALAEYRIAVDLAPNDEIYHFSVACMLEELKRYEEALAEYRIAVNLAPNDDFYHYSVADMLEELNKYEEALAEYNIAVQLNPDDELNHYGAAKMFERLERYDEALREYEYCVKINPTDYDNHRALGRILEKLNNREEALTKYNEAIKLGDNSGISHWRIAEIYSSLGRNEEALIFIKQSNELAPNLAKVYVTMAYILRKLGRVEEAEEIDQKVLDLRKEP